MRRRADSLQGLLDRAILAVLLYHGLRREEAAQLSVIDIQERCGITICAFRAKVQAALPAAAYRRCRAYQ